MAPILVLDHRWCAKAGRAPGGVAEQVASPPRAERRLIRWSESPDAYSLPTTAGVRPRVHRVPGVPRALFTERAGNAAYLGRQWRRENAKAWLFDIRIAIRGGGCGRRSIAACERYPSPRVFAVGRVARRSGAKPGRVGGDAAHATSRVAPPPRPPRRRCLRIVSFGRPSPPRKTRGEGGYWRRSLLSKRTTRSGYSLP
jgi:hypothetical protein